MTNATVEKIARLMLETFRQRWDERNPDRPSPTWEQEKESRRDYYRACARAVLKALGR